MHSASLQDIGGDAKLASKRSTQDHVTYSAKVLVANSGLLASFLTDHPSVARAQHGSRMKSMCVDSARQAREVTKW